MFLHYLIVSIRNLLKYKVQSAISIIGLAVGFTCFAICSYMLRVNLDWNSHIADVDRICFIYSTAETEPNTCNYRSAGGLLAKDFPEIEAATAYCCMGPYTDKLCEVTHGGTHYFNEKFLFADSTFLDFFSIRLLSGNREEILRTPNALLVTEKTALKLYQTLDVVGKTFTHINDFDNKTEAFTIYGVISDFPQHSNLAHYSGIELNTTNQYILRMYDDAFTPYVKIRKGTDLNLLNKKLKAYTLKFPLKDNQPTEVQIQLKPLREFNSFISKGEHMKPSLVFLTIGVLVLLTALFNYLIFIFGRMLNRVKECGIRKVNGAGKRATFMLFFTESSLAFIAACFISVILAELLVPFINSNIPYLAIEKRYLITLLLQYAAFGIGGIALLCLAVTQKLTYLSVMQRIQSEKVLRRYTISRHLFICIQLVICFLFMGGTWFIHQQSELLEDKLTGELSEKERTCLFEVSLSGDKFTPARQDILRKLRENPNIEGIVRSGMNLFGAWQLGPGRFTWEGISEEESQTTLGHIYADANFADFIHAEPSSGRLFTLEESDKAVVNESFARLLKRNPIGMQIGVKYWGDTMEYYLITGVIPDIINNQNEINTRPVLPCIYMPYPENHINMTCLIQVKEAYRHTFPADMKALLYKYVNAATPVYVNNMKENVTWYLQSETTLYKATSLFSVICILISLLGIYASVSLSTEKRKREVAIRKVHGATPKDILWMFGSSNLLLLVLAAGIAFPLLLYILHLWLQNYATHIAIGVMPFLLLFLLLGMIVMLTVVWLILNIARSNPAEVIKSE